VGINIDIVPVHKELCKTHVKKAYIFAANKKNSEGATFLGRNVTSNL
jgi:hypothetical protein